MSQEFYFGEGDVRRFDRFESLLERIASKLEEPAPSASTNNARDVIALIVEEHAKVRSTKGYAVTSFYNAVSRILLDYSRATTPVA